MNRAITFSVLFALIASLMLLSSCAGQRETKIPPVTDTLKVVEDSTVVQVEVIVPQENIRVYPNGPIEAVVQHGQRFPLEQRRGNWCQVELPDLTNSWIWAPSLGFEQVNILDVHLWLGHQQPRTLDSLKNVIGSPVTVDELGGEVFVYHYPNEIEDHPGSLFGTWKFNEALVWVDRETRTAFRLEFVLPPFEGSAQELLEAAGLEPVKSTKTDFERAIYTNKFTGLHEVELLFVESDFNRIAHLTATRLPRYAWTATIEEGEKKLKLEGDDLVLSMELTNNGEYAFVAPVIHTTVLEAGRHAGEWTLGPAQLRLEPGETEILEIPIPLGADEVDIKQVTASAEITDGYTVPASSAAQL